MLAAAGQVNNAGLFLFKPATECTAEDYSRMMATNLESCFHLSQLAHPLLRKSAVAGGGSVVHVSSIASCLGSPNVAIYSTAKGTVLISTAGAKYTGLFWIRSSKL
jgi:Tropinone reductase 1